MTTAKITTTSSDSAIVEPIVLRDGAIARLVFRPVIVNNSRDHLKPVRGELLWQRRKPSETEWVDESHLKLSSMTSGSGVKLELNTDELHQLTQAVRGLYGVFWKHGHTLPSTGEVFELAEYAQAAKSLDALGDIASIVSTAGAEGFATLIRLLAQHDNSVKVLDAADKLDLADLSEISSLAGIGMLRQVLKTWEANKGNASEGFWQETLAKHSFVFSQLFSAPVVVFGEKAYVGGKSIEGVGGKYPDFLLKNALTAHVLIVEIKTPATQLLGSSPYRPPDVFAVEREVTGALAQIGKYKDGLLKSYANLALQSEEKFLLAEPRCVVVVGCTDELDSTAKKDSFEIFRRGQRATEVITFDELFKKIEILLALLEGSEDVVSKPAAGARP